jgi:hypothetical protein
MNATIVNALSAMAILAAPVRFAAASSKFETSKQISYRTAPAIGNVSFHQLALQ